MATQFTVKWDASKAKDVTSASVEGLRDATEFLLDESNRLVPVDEGTLQNSGNTSVDKGAMTAAVYYDTPYAVRVHEDTTARHKNGRKAKYLETAFKANQNKIQEIIAGKINDKIGDK